MAAKVLSVPHLPEKVSLYAGLLTAHILIPELVIFPLQKANLLPEKIYISSPTSLHQLFWPISIKTAEQVGKKKVHLVLLKIFKTTL